jgi:superfamily II DNA/RNA helicase
MAFKKFKLREELQKAIVDLNFTLPTVIQQKSIPLLLEGKDIIGQSFTGSGKTAAFGFPLLEKVVPGKGVQALVLTPTRELCVQVEAALVSFGKYLPTSLLSIYGGVSIEPQIKKLRSADILVGTPGRILDHLQRRTLSLDTVQFLVIDEADKMLEMGFIEDVERIISQTSKNRQTALFSATMPPQIQKLTNRYMNNPEIVKAEVNVDRTKLKQVYYNIDQRDKFSLLAHCLQHETPGLAMVFCGTRHMVDAVTYNLKKQNIHALAIHGGMTQNKRTQSLDALRKQKVGVLVATDVAARGLDIRDVSHVYNYDVPPSAEEYVHRIGRTARAGASGDAVTLLTRRDYDNFQRVLRDRSLNIESAEVPQFPRISFDPNGREPREEGFRGGGSRGGGFRGRSSQRSSGGFRGSPRSSGGFGSRSRDGESAGYRGRSSEGDSRPRSFGAAREGSPARFGSRSRDRESAGYRGRSSEGDSRPRSFGAAREGSPARFGSRSRDGESAGYRGRSKPKTRESSPKNFGRKPRKSE